MVLSTLTSDDARAILAVANGGLDSLDEGGLSRADAAAWLLLQHHLSGIISGAVEPRAGLEVIETEVRWPYLAQLQLGPYPWQYSCQSHDYHHLYGLYVVHDDLTSRPHEVSWDGLYGESALAAWGQSVIAETRAWFQRRGEPGTPPDPT